MDVKIFCEECDLEVKNRGAYFKKIMLSCECRNVVVTNEQLENIDEIIKKNYEVFKWIRRGKQWVNLNS